MTEKKNNSRRLYYILAPIAIAISIVVFFQTQIDSKIRNHPKIVTMDVNQKNTEKSLEEIKEQLEEIDSKVDRLLREEYP